MTTKELKRENALLARELGYNPFGEGLYQWQWSENLLHPRHIPGKYDYVANPETGVIEARQVFELRRLCPMLDHQWVLCMWMSGGSESAWRKEYGGQLEWPRRGWLMPTNVDLHPGVEPNEIVMGQSWTELVVNMYKEQRKKTFADFYRESEEGLARKERDEDQKMDEIIGAVRLPFDHVPGKKDHVSLPSPESYKNKENV